MSQRSAVRGSETVDTLLRVGLRTPERPALHQHDAAISFGELDERVRRIARGLAELGIGHGDHLAVWLPACPEWLEVFLAATRLGALVIAVNTRLRGPEVEDLLARARPRLLVMWPDFRGVDFASILGAVSSCALSGVERVVTVHGELDPALGLATIALDALRESSALDEVAAAPQDRCLVFASSGTTSRPKLVVHRQEVITAHARAVAAAYGYDADDAVLMLPLPLCGTFGFTGLVGCLSAGHPTVLMDVFEPAAATELVARHRATHILAGDDMLRGMLATDTDGQLATLRSGFYGLFSGDAAGLVALGDAHGIGLSSGYGSTEVCALFTHTGPQAPVSERVVTGGLPVHPSTVVRVRDVDTGSLVGAGREGELEISAPTTLDGLLEDPERERERFTDDGFVRTGDIGLVAEDGRLVYLRRAGDAMRLGGFLVAPREIEEALERLLGVGGAQVVEVTVDGEPRPFAFVVGADGGARPSGDEVARVARRDLARHKQPVRVVVLDAFPLVASPNGNKIDRRGLRERAQALVDGAG